MLWVLVSLLLILYLKHVLHLDPETFFIISASPFHAVYSLLPPSCFLSCCLWSRRLAYRMKMGTLPNPKSPKKPACKFLLLWVSLRFLPLSTAALFLLINYSQHNNLNVTYWYCSRWFIGGGMFLKGWEGDEESQRWREDYGLISFMFSPSASCKFQTK